MDTKLYAILNELNVLAKKAKDLLNIIYCNMTAINTHSTNIYANTLRRE